MILYSLHQYYNRLKDDTSTEIATPGYAPQKISFAVEIDKNGKLIQIKDIRNVESKKPQPVELIVPYIGKRTSKPLPNFLWDNTKYVFGVDDNGNRAKKDLFELFKVFNKNLCAKSKVAEVKAFIGFLSLWNPSDFKTISNWQEINGKNIVFLLVGKRKFFHEIDDFKVLWDTYLDSFENKKKGFCLITGKYSNIEEVHFPLKGIYDPGGQAEKAIISFNKASFCSYQKEQSLNAPISSNAMFAYTTALNYLLRFDSRQKMQIGDATTVFWTERKSPVENLWGEVFSPPSTAISDNKEVYNYLSAIRAGKNPPGIDTGVKMYILGLSPNAARIALRFWIVNTIESFNKHLGEHLKNIQIQTQFDSDKDFPGIWRILIETLPKKKELRKTENINPVLAGALTRSVLNGGHYPESLLCIIISRLRADGDISYYRMGMLKAVLIKNHNMEVSMALDEENNNIAYRLGRLFAVLEKAQEEAIPGANATIKDRFFGSASATPRVVMPQLIRMSQHHLSKIGG
ncbi:MAG: type I-C CRISPR-associated protein Cas8c/Csd1, partial [Bacteroidales bacterium]|nr:type I-C CRISPR-associated protein Cas8c/Csd1 [Bacteroidales bacterium]